MSLKDVNPIHLKLIDQLESTGNFRVLRSIAIPRADISPLKSGERIAIIIDTETTGLDLRDDEVVEIGIIAFTYDEDDNFVRILDTFEGMREPDNAMSEEAKNITGITSDMLLGKNLNIERLIDIVESSNLIIAHNAYFDRPMCEKLLSLFEKKAWACSATEIPWKGLGFEGAKLGYLLYQCGFFYKGHRALEDCYALLNVLTTQQGTEKLTPLQHLLASARETRLYLEVQSPFEMRAFFKSRGYRWRSHPTKRWSIDLPETLAMTELSELEKLQHAEVRIAVSRKTAFDRFKM